MQQGHRRPRVGHGANIMADGLADYETGVSGMNRSRRLLQQLTALGLLSGAGSQD